jgi:hypothetical protein
MSLPSDLFPFVDLVYPDQMDLGPFVSWERAVSRVAQLPPPALARCEQRYTPSALQHPNPQVREFAERFRSGSPEERARVVCLGAVLERALVVLVKHPVGGEAFELKLLIWQGKALLVCHPLSLVSTGVFAPTVAQLPSASLSSRLSGSALYVREQQLTSITTYSQRVSAGELDRRTRLIVDEYKKAGKKIKFADFQSRMKQETGGSRRQIERAWSAVPDCLKYMHRPRSR